jgi:myo-inositol 2-dehydrogenase / D-chiro-inositol 1-dehydrogenase
MTSRNESTPGAASRLSRRNFVAGSYAAALALSVVQPRAVRGSQANSKISLGLIGCGGRGGWITDLFLQHGGYTLAAVADYFPERVDQVGGKFGVAADQRFTGLACYHRLLEQDLDAVVIQTPPYFHPEQAAAAVDAGKHVFVAKPVAVDVPGSHSIEASGRKATEKGLCFLVDFQTRADEHYIECIRRVHEGAIGEFAFGESTYHAGIPWTGQIRHMQNEPDNPETRLRAWGLDRAMSGDIITEQNVHTLDVMSWIMNQPPVCACGTGARKVRDFGDCFDTFSLVFQYPDNVGITFSSRQFEGHGTQPEGIRNRMFGTAGVLETSYGGATLIRGKNFYRGGSSPAIYRDGAVTNIATFHDDIRNGRHENPTVAPSVRSNLVTILGRQAAYTGQCVSWEELQKSDERLEADLSGLKA